jgi:hypothetical protein
LPVHEEGRRPVDGALLRGRGFASGDDGLSAGFDGVVLIVRLLLVRVIQVLLAFLEGFGACDLVGGWLLTGGKELLDGRSCHGGVLHDAVGQDVVGMTHHAGAGVGCIPHVAVFDDEALPITDIGHVGQGVVLLRIEDAGEGAEQDGGG